MSQPDFDVEQAQRDYDAARGGAPAPAPGEADPNDPTPDPALDPDAIQVDELDGGDNPPGFMGYEEYVKQGGDPDRYRGKQAFADEHDRIQENKRLRKDVKGLQTTVQQTMDAVNTWQGTEREKMRKELTAELNQAREDDDIDGALAAQKGLDTLDATPAPSAQPQQQPDEHPVIETFRTANPLIDMDSPQFNAEFNQDVQALYNETAAKLGRNGAVGLTDGQISRALNKAVKDARELHADLFESPRNERQRPGGRQQRRPAQREPEGTAEGYVIKDPRNPTQGNAAVQVRETIRTAAIAAAKKAGKNDADQKTAGDTAAQNFERSLHR